MTSMSRRRRVVSINQIVGLAEAAAVLGVSKENLVLWTKRYPTFPVPIARLQSTRVWDRVDLQRWHEKWRSRL